MAVRYATLDKAQLIGKRLPPSQRKIELNQRPHIAERIALWHARLLLIAYRKAKVERSRLISQRFSDSMLVEEPGERHGKENAVINIE